MDEYQLLVLSKNRRERKDCMDWKPFNDSRKLITILNEFESNTNTNHEIIETFNNHPKNVKLELGYYNITEYTLYHFNWEGIEGDKIKPPINGLIVLDASLACECDDDVIIKDLNESKLSVEDYCLDCVQFHANNYGFSDSLVVNPKKELNETVLGKKRLCQYLHLKLSVTDESQMQEKLVLFAIKFTINNRFIPLPEKGDELSNFFPFIIN